MIEAYKVGVSLALDSSSVTTGLTKVSGQFEALNRVVKNVQGSVDKLAGAMQGLSGIGTAAALGRDAITAGPPPGLRCTQEPCAAARAVMVPPNVAALSACGGAAWGVAYDAISEVP